MADSFSPGQSSGPPSTQQDSSLILSPAQPSARRSSFCSHPLGKILGLEKYFASLKRGHTVEASASTPFFSCSMCHVSADPIPFRVCQGPNHVLCYQCYGADPLVHSGICPVDTDGKGVCGNLLVGPELGLPAYFDHLLKQNQYPCSSSKYGCTFSGTGYDVLRHEESGCPFSYMKVCDLIDPRSEEKCGLKFNDIFDLIQHKVRDHGEDFGNFTQTCTVSVSTESSDKLGEAWVRHSTQVIAYGCTGLKRVRCGLLVVEENQHAFRMWVTELNPNGVENVKYELLFPDNVEREQRKPLYFFVDEMLPYLKIDFTEGEEDDVRYFEISKNIVRKYADKAPDGQLHFRMLAIFWVEGLPDDDDHSSTITVDEICCQTPPLTIEFDIHKTEVAEYVSPSATKKDPESELKVTPAPLKTLPVQVISPSMAVTTPPVAVIGPSISVKSPPVPETSQPPVRSPPVSAKSEPKRTPPAPVITSPTPVTSLPDPGKSSSTEGVPQGKKEPSKTLKVKPKETQKVQDTIKPIPDRAEICDDASAPKLESLVKEGPVFEARLEITREVGTAPGIPDNSKMKPEVKAGLRKSEIRANSEVRPADGYPKSDAAEIKVASPSQGPGNGYVKSPPQLPPEVMHSRSKRVNPTPRKSPVKEDDTPEPFPEPGTASLEVRGSTPCARSFPTRKRGMYVPPAPRQKPLPRRPRDES